jgi:hypothetical protein
VTRGPDQQRLLDYVTPGRDDHLMTAEDQWRKGASILSQMATQLRAKARAIRESSDVEFSGATAATAADAFDATAVTMDTKSKDMHDGSAAFGSASSALQHAQAASDHLEKHAPGPFPKDPGIPPGSSQPEDVKAQSDYDTAVTKYWHDYHANERAARHAIATLEANHTEQAKVFQRIHGEVPPTQTGGGGGGNPVDQGTPATTTHVPGGGLTGPGHATFDPSHNTTGDPHPTVIHPGLPDETGFNLPPHTGPVDPGVPQGPGVHQGPSVPAGPGLPGPVGGVGTVGGGAGAMGGVGAVAGGALGGAAAAGLAAGGLNGGLNGLMPAGAGGVRGSLSASGVRGIGATSRTGVGSVLGRGTGASGRAGAGGMAGSKSGRGGGRSTVSRGARGRAGGRAGAGAGAGRGGKDKKRQGEERDLFDDGSDWIDDEDAAPGLID